MSPMKSLLLAGLAVLAGCAHPPGEPSRFSVVEAGIPELQQALAEGRVTSRQLVLEYLARIGVHQNRLNAAASVNPRALEEAEVLDRERAQGRIRGPLHGIPVALKDNIHTTRHADDRRRAGVRRLVPPYEATLTKNLARRRRDHPRQDASSPSWRTGSPARRADAGQLQRRSTATA